MTIGARVTIATGCPSETLRRLVTLPVISVVGSNQQRPTRCPECGHVGQLQTFTRAEPPAEIRRTD